jgi:probable rRNA maturation factor
VIRRRAGLLADPAFPLSRSELSALARTVAQALGLDPETLAVELVDDAAIAELNSRFLGLSGPTNCLAFPADSPGHLGDIALNADALPREAFLYAQPPRTYTARLLAHAMLHCAGLDHGPDMEAMTEAAVAAVGGEE